ncbi:MAG: phage tail protein [Acidobacteria bacterium]|nr:phage tail protein [Acidobacteriota bacterium]
MSCGGGNQNFRLLDGFVGWDQADDKGLDRLSFNDAEGLRLAQIKPDAVPPAVVLAYLPPPRLARGCGRCDWFLVYQTRLLRRDCCAPDWKPVWSEACDQHLLKDGVAVAARSHRVAVSDADAKRVWVWERDGEQLIASINTEHLISDAECDRPNAANRIARPGPLAFTPWGELLVVDAETNSVWRFGPAGEARGKLMIAMPALAFGETIDRLAASDDCSIWLVTRASDGSLKLWRAARGDREFKKAKVEQLQKAFKPTGLTAVDEEKGFCLEECGPDGLPVTHCFGWDGEPIQTEIAPPPPPPRHKLGQLLTRAIDSGIPRCRWHRVRIDADTPPGTTLSIAVATSETARELDESVKSQDAGWEDFPAGAPHPLDWQVSQPGTTDFLINQPTGRYLYLRLRLKGDGAATPVARRVRIDFPRVTSLDYLPPVYRDNPEAEDFTERFLALFDASIADLDRAIERAPALLDPDGLPDEALPWIGSFLDVVFDPAWAPDLRRKVLHALPGLYRRRGTIAGLTEAIKLVFGVEPAIQELAAERNWGSVAKRDGTPLQNAAQLGAVRLFGKSRARFRLNRSSLGNAPLRSYGNPDHDPLLAQVYRFRVLIPPLSLTADNARQRLEQLIASQKPAHTVVSIRFGGEGFILGNTSAVGVDTVIAPLPRPVLGKAGNVRLRRMSVLWHGAHGARKGMLIGETSVVGVQTIVE